MSENTITNLLERIGAGSTAHGLRSAFGGWTDDTGEDHRLAEMCLAHTVKNAVEAAYYRTDIHRPPARAPTAMGRFSHKLLVVQSNERGPPRSGRASLSPAHMGLPRKPSLLARKISPLPRARGSTGRDRAGDGREGLVACGAVDVRLADGGGDRLVDRLVREVVAVYAGLLRWLIIGLLVVAVGVWMMPSGFWREVVIVNGAFLVARQCYMLLKRYIKEGER